MIFLDNYIEIYPRSQHPSLRGLIATTPYPLKDQVVNYLKKGSPTIAGCYVPHDAFTDKQIDTQFYGMTDGTYHWSNVLIYYVDKYNIKLPDDFINHILSKSME